jgi:hypothetical protein
MATTFRSIAFIFAVGWLFSIIVRRVEKAHEKWLRENRLAITATVKAVIGKYRPGELSDFTVIAIGEDPMTRELREYKFLSIWPGHFHRGAVVNLKVNPRKSSDYTFVPHW